MGGSSTKDLDYSHRNGDGSQSGGEQTQEAQSDLVNTVTLDSYNERLFVCFFGIYCIAVWPSQHTTHIHIT